MIVKKYKKEMSGPFLHPKKYYQDMKKYKKQYFIILPIAFILGLVYAFGFPDYYTCVVKVSPELSNRPSYDGIGFNMINPDYQTIYPDLYPKLMNGKDFQASLLPIKVKRQSDGAEFTYYDYLLNEQKKPWWIILKRKVLGKNDDRVEESKIYPFRPTSEQSDLMMAISDLIVCDVTPKTFVVTIKVMDQDPLVAATLADSVRNRLQQFLTDYHTTTSLNEVAYYKKVCQQAKMKYDAASKDYSSFMDANREILSQSMLSKQTYLENEMQIRLAAFEELYKKLQNAEMSAQEDKPSFVTIKSATIPLEPSEPSRASMCFKWMFFVFALITSWVFYKEDDWSDILGLNSNN